MFTKKLTLDIIKKWKNEACSTILKIIDLNDYSISLFDNNKVKKKIDKSSIDALIEKYSINSYPVILVIKNNTLIESIFGNYPNIIDIIDMYL